MTLRDRISGLFRRPPEIAVLYDPSYRIPIAAFEGATGAEPRRADLVAWWLQENGHVPKACFERPRRATWAEMERVHTPALLDSLVVPGTLGDIFAVDAADVPLDEALRTIRLVTGGTIEAARIALQRKISVLNLAGGFHHASPNRAGGFCPVNDIAIAVACMRQDHGFVGRVAVIDLDAHPPDGTADCFAGDPRVWIGSISGSAWGALPGVDEVYLPKADDAAYLVALRGLLSRMPKPDLAFVLAGGDVLAGDRFGGLALTVAGARERDLAVRAALASVPSVWLPAGGYHKDAWRVLAGTALALAHGSREAVVDEPDPLRSHISRIARTIPESDLGSSSETWSDFLGELGAAPGRPAFLGFYSSEGLELGLSRYGILGHIERLGYHDFRASIGRTGTGDSMKLTGKDSAGAEHVLIELVADKTTIAGKPVLFVNWLTLRNPTAARNREHPLLPGQEVPGLGLAREAGEMLRRIAERLGLAGFAFRPAWFHTAYPARRSMRFVDPARQSRFEALVRDLSALPLSEATKAISEKRVLLDGVPYTWEADEMVYWLEPPAPGPPSPLAGDAPASRFTVV